MDKQGYTINLILNFNLDTNTKFNKESIYKTIKPNTTSKQILKMSLSSIKNWLTQNKEKENKLI